MTCTGREKEQALYVAGDLAPAESARIEAHLAACPTCRALASRFERQREALRALAGEPVASDALARVRARVREGLRDTSRAGLPWDARWIAMGTVSGSLVVMTAVILVLVLSGREPEGVSSVRSSPAPAARLAARLPIDQARVAVTAPPVRAASTRRATAIRARVISSPPRPVEAPVAALSPDDADRLARALVYVSQLDGLPRAEEEAREEPAVASTPLARFETADPNVVFYWLLDSNGGSS